MSKPLYSLFLLFIILVTCYADSSNTSSLCAPSVCGNVSIRYPFWMRSNTTVAGEYCGYPEFGIECSEGNKAVINLPRNKYYVTDINYEIHSITLIDIDVLSQSCPRARQNVTLDNLPLDFNSSLDLNLNFYFNCSSAPSSVEPIGCWELRNDNRKSYVFPEGDESDHGSHWDCQDHVVVTVKHDEIDISTTTGLLTGFGNAMKKGFVLDWSRAVDCADCEQSGGNCVYNETTRQSTCQCRDGRFAAKSCKKDHAGKRKVIIGIGSAAIAGLLICIIICCIIRKSSIWQERYWLMTKKGLDIETFLKDHRALLQKRYKFSEVKKMTNSFKDKLGQGGFGAVYKGKLLNGRLVAVKILKASKGNGEEFINEVASISRTSHVNIVNLLGFCFEGYKKALIYEFMSNGSLDKFIYNKGNKAIASLNWENLYQISIGIARGLEYLHRGCNTRILHFDIKPHNILLDENLCPKISDFGLAKLCPKRESIISMSDARGTMGYVAPEVWNRHFGGVSHKSDVYSYGMMILEMVGGRKNINVETSHTSEIYFPHWLYNRLELGNDLRPDGVIAAEENEIARRMAIVGLWCIQTFPSDRPTMSRVIDMLEGNMNSLEMPPKPFLSSPSRSVPESSTS